MRKGVKETYMIVHNDGSPLTPAFFHAFLFFSAFLIDVLHRPKRKMGQNLLKK